MDYSSLYEKKTKSDLWSKRVTFTMHKYCINCVDRNTILYHAAYEVVRYVLRSARYVYIRLCNTLADVWFCFSLFCSLRTLDSPFICCFMYFAVMALDV